jgi:hypothetical protein
MAPVYRSYRLVASVSTLFSRLDTIFWQLMMLWKRVSWTMALH